MPVVTTPEHVERLQKLGACQDAVDWAADYEDPQAAWDACERGDWMMWLCGRLSGKPESDRRKKLVLCACECARLALPNVPAGQERPLRCIETAERWARGEATIGELRDARRRMWACYAAIDAAAAAASDAAAAANYAAKACANDDTWNRARKATLKKCADIVRRHYPAHPFATTTPDLVIGFVASGPDHAAEMAALLGASDADAMYGDAIVDGRTTVLIGSGFNEGPQTVLLPSGRVVRTWLSHDCHGTHVRAWMTRELYDADMASVRKLEREHAERFDGMA